MFLVRLRRRCSMFQVLSTLVVAACVGVHVVVLSFVNAFWFRRTPVDGQVVVVLHRLEKGDGSRFTDRALAQFRSLPIFEDVAGQVVTRGSHIGLLPRVVFQDVGHEVETLGVTQEYFRVLGLQVLGRDFGRDDDRYGSEPVAIISHRLWSRAFGGRREVLDSIVPASPRPLRVIGIAPPAFHGALTGEDVDLWLPHNLLPQVTSTSLSRVLEGSLPMINLCRLRPEVSIETARASFRSASRPANRELDVVPVSRLFGAPDLPTVVIKEDGMITLAASTSTLVLLGGWATLVALLLVHFEQRKSEFALRLALGATSSNLTKTLLMELGAIAVVGSVGALVLGQWVVGLLPRFALPGGVDLGRLDFGIDGRVVAGVLLTGLVTLLVAAAVPIKRFTRPEIIPSLVSPGSMASRSSLRLRRIVLAVHVAATTIVLVGAILFIRVVRHGLSSGAGFDEDRTVFVTVETRRQFEQTPPAELAAEAARRLAASDALVEAIRSMPGVEAVALGDAPIGSHVEEQLSFAQPIDIGGDDRYSRVAWLSTSPGYMSALGVKSSVHSALSADQAIITSTLAQQLWPDQSPVGRYLAVGAFKGTVAGTVNLTVGSQRLGKVAAVFSGDLEASLPAVMRDSGHLSLVVRTMSPEHVGRQLRDHIHQVFPDAAFVAVITGEQLVANDIGRERFAASFFATFGLVALVLSVGSVFGLVAHFAEHSKRSFGLMLALGATQSRIVRHAAWMGLLPTIVGSVLGLFAAACLARAMQSMFLGIPVIDPLSYCAVFVFLTTCTGIAGILGAWRVVGVSPAEALRMD